MTTPILALDEISESQSQKSVSHNAALRALETRTVRALDKDLTTPPGSPTDGQAWIVPAGATGIWSGKTNQIAAYIGTGWVYWTPIEGARLWLNDEDKEYVFDGSAWIVLAVAGAAGTVTSVALTVPAELSVAGSPITTSGTLAVTKANQSANLVYAGPTSGGAAAPAFRALVAADVPAQPYDVGSFIEPAPTASQVVLRHVTARAVTFPSSLTGSYGKAGTAATAQTDFDLQKGGVSFGTMRFAAAGTSATFLSASGTTTAAGDVITAIGPATPDATLAKITFTLAGTR